MRGKDIDTLGLARQSVRSHRSLSVLEGANAHSAGPCFYACGCEGLWGWGGGWGWCKIKAERRKVINNWFNHDAQINTQTCWNPFQNNPKSKRSGKTNGGSLGAGSVLGCQNGATLNNMDQHGAKRTPKGSPKLPKWIRCAPKGDQKNRKNDVQER